ncbi:aldehyde ferredoxin oxidoreductase family protein [Chloroflexota bacterium]
MYKGVMGKILLVNLSIGEINVEEPKEELYRDFLGGYGLGARVLFSRQKAKVDPLGPDNMIGFVSGVLTGTPAPLATRYMVVAKSPLTGGWADANSGGDFGPYLKFAGYDAVFFSGASEKPVYLSIDNGKAELKDASSLWGKDTVQTEDTLKDELGKDIRIACIGPSGEAMSLISCIVNEKGRVAGRAGLGAVMGSKKLKAVVVQGKMKVEVANEEEVARLRKESLETIKGSAFAQRMQKAGGTSAFTDGMIMRGEAPVKNWAGAGPIDFPEAEKLSGALVLERMQKKYGCWRCPVACGGIMKEGVGEYKYPAGTHKPEYETEGAFGSMCLNTNLESIIMASDICNRYGFDTISAGATVAFAMECYENGLITKEDTGGIELTWGNHEAIVKITEQMGKREGFGAVLADGSKVAAEKIGKGAEQYTVHVDGQEPAMHDPKNSPRFATGYMMDAAPGRHTQSGTDPIEGAEQKAANTYCQAYNAAGMCMWGGHLAGQRSDCRVSDCRYRL